MFDDMTKKIDKKDLILLDEKEMNSIYEDILFEQKKDNNPYNISEWYALDLNKYYKEDEIDQDYPYQVLIKEEGIIKEWGDFLTKELVKKIQK